MSLVGGYDEYSFVAEFYDHISPYLARQDVDFFVEMAQQSGGPVLEIGCGTGRVLIPTARAGNEIVGGRLILDLFNPSLPYLVDEQRFEESGDEPEFTMPDGRRVMRHHRIASRDLFNQVQNAELIYYVTHPDGREERLVHSFPMRYLFRFEAEHLLARSGFRVEMVYADYDKSLYGSKYPGELIFVASKVG